MHAGQLIYLMGASGTGKDSLLRYLRAHLPAHAPVILPTRYITRPANAGGENHFEITPGEFQKRQAAGDFAMHWQSHGYSYGIGYEVDQALKQGFTVVLNGSRHYLEKAQQRYPSLRPILIKVSHDTLLQRLIQRGRENSDEIERRLQRAEALDRHLRPSEITVLNNDGPLHAAGETLLKLILATPNLDRESLQRVTGSEQL